MEEDSKASELADSNADSNNDRRAGWFVVVVAAESNVGGAGSIDVADRSVLAHGRHGDGAAAARLGWLLCRPAFVDKYDTVPFFLSR